MCMTPDAGKAGGAATIDSGINQRARLPGTLIVSTLRAFCSFRRESGGEPCMTL